MTEPVGDPNHFQPSLRTSIIIAGAPGSGKTAAAHNMVALTALCEHDVHVVALRADNTAAYEPFRPWLNTLAATPADAEDLLEALTLEAARRYQLDVGLRPVLLIVDSVDDLASQNVAGGDATRRALTMLQALAPVAAQVGITVAVTTEGAAAAVTGAEYYPSVLELAGNNRGVFTTTGAAATKVRMWHSVADTNTLLRALDEASI